MIYDVGEFSGIVWRLLSERGELTTATIKRETKENDFMVGAALGWLAREGKIELQKSGRSIKAALK